MTTRVSQKVAVSVVYVAAMFMTIMDSNYPCANTGRGRLPRPGACARPCGQG